MEAGDIGTEPAPRVSGDGFITLSDGTRRWGRFGAAGLLVRHTDADGAVAYFLARRSEHCHRGGTWAIPGGALDGGEEPLEGALREFQEEIGVSLDHFELDVVYEDDHGGWSYWTYILDVEDRFEPPGPLSWETSEVRWVTPDELADLELFDAFDAALTHLGLQPDSPDR